MSISGSLGNALSGLAVASRSAELVSSNVANAGTPGYGRRVLNVTGSVVGGVGNGARGHSVERVINYTAMTDRRLAEASVGFNQTTASYFAGIEISIGDPSNAGSLNARLAALESALISAAASPESVARLRDVGDRAADIVTAMNRVSNDIRSARQQADVEIGDTVDRLNTALKTVDIINKQIVRQTHAGQDVSSLMDERQTAIDQISEIVPIREVARENGRVALITDAGSTLVGDNAAEVIFTPTNLVLPHMTRDNGLLSGLQIIGAESTPGDAHFSLNGGKLEALFELRDVHSVQSLSQIDAFARNLVDRFADAGVDPSIGVGQPGLFTDQGLAFDPLDEVGLAGRLRLNAAVDPNQGGSLTALRDGLYAPPGPTGNATVLNAMAEAMNAVETPVSGSFQAAGSLSALAASLVSDASQGRLSAEKQVSFSSAQTTALRELEAQSAVDTDQEMQTLLLIEQLYAANAKVISTVDEMLQQILGL